MRSFIELSLIDFGATCGFCEHISHKDNGITWISKRPSHFCTPSVLAPHSVPFSAAPQSLQLLLDSTMTQTFVELLLFSFSSLVSSTLFSVSTPSLCYNININHQGDSYNVILYVIFCRAIVSSTSSSLKHSASAAVGWHSDGSCSNRHSHSEVNVHLSH